MHDIATASKMLGVHFSPVGNFDTHVEHMVQKGLDWVDCLQSKPLSRGNAWMNFYLQLFPGISWGLVTVCLHPCKLDTMIQWVYAKALPLLGVNYKVKKAWETLPKMYQGLALPNFPLVALADKITFLLGDWGFLGLAHSNSLAMAYNNFLMEVGLYDSPLCWSFEDYGHLSTDATWFHNLWLLVHIFKVELIFHEDCQVQGVCEGNWLLMSNFFCLGYYGKELAALNIVRRFQNLLHVSDIVKCDGVTLDKFVVLDSTEESVLHVFPHKEPTQSDHRLWYKAINRLCSGSSSLPYTLGQYVHLPHLPCTWFTTDLSEVLYRVREEEPSPSHYFYHLQDGRVSTRYGQQCDWRGLKTGTHPCTHYASVTLRSTLVAVLHSQAPFPFWPVPYTTFHETLESFRNPSQWINLSIDGDGEWIGQSLSGGFLCIAHDGSYMPKESVDMCLAGVVMYCQESKNWLKVAVVKHSNKASNHQGELLGAVMSLLILRAASSMLYVLYPLSTLFCDNRGVILHSNSLQVSLLEKQVQADLIQLIKHLSSTNNCQSMWEWVEGHAVEQKGWHNCTLSEHLNHQANILAKGSLLAGLHGTRVIEGDFPFAPVHFKLSDVRVCGSPRLALEADWGYHTAKSLFDKKGLVRAANFHLLWWDGVRRAMKGYSKMYRVWLTKHVSEFCGSNVQMYNWSKGKKSLNCEFCLTADKYTMHICRCHDSGCSLMFKVSVNELTTWLRSTLGEQCIAATVEQYLLSSGKALMTDCVHGNYTELAAVATASNCLGWDSMLEGWISTYWLILVAPFLLKTGQYLLPQAWGTQFITRLINIVHKQWIYRNLVIHYRGKDSLTIPEHHDIINRVESHSLTDPDLLLPRHQF
jgi:hypothetical protein